MREWRNTREVIPLYNRAEEPRLNVEALASSREGGVWVAGNRRLRRFAQGKWVADCSAPARGPKAG